MGLGQVVVQRFDSAPCASSGLDGGMSMGAAFGQRRRCGGSGPGAVPVPAPAPPMPSTPPPQSAASGACARAGGRDAVVRERDRDGEASPDTCYPPDRRYFRRRHTPPRPPGGSFAQPAAAGVSAQPSPARPSGAPPQGADTRAASHRVSQMTSGAEGQVVRDPEGELR